MTQTHLTRVVAAPQGINLLGGLEVIAAFGALALAMSVDWPTPWAGAAVVATAAGLITVFDFAWRLLQVEPASWRRLISPFTGGCFLFVPLWVWALPAFLFLLMVALHR
jgi:hypothetical protein